MSLLRHFQDYPPRCLPPPTFHKSKMAAQPSSPTFQNGDQKLPPIFIFNFQNIFQISNFIFQILFFKFYFSNFIFQISNFIFQILFFRFQILFFKFQISNFKFYFSDFIFQISNFKFYFSEYFSNFIF